MKDKDRRLARGRPCQVRDRIHKAGVGDLYVVNRAEASDLAALVVGSSEAAAQAAQRKLNRAVVASGQAGIGVLRQDISFRSRGVL